MVNIFQLFLDQQFPLSIFFRGELKKDFVNFEQSSKLKGRLCHYSGKRSVRQGCSHNQS